MIRQSGAVVVLLVVGGILIWAGFTGRLPAVLGAILAPSELSTGGVNGSETAVLPPSARPAPPQSEPSAPQREAAAAAHNTGAGPGAADLMILEAWS